MALISILLQEGFLENWREHDSLHKGVFEAAAVFPLPNGLQSKSRRIHSYPAHLKQKGSGDAAASRGPANSR
jgi:hypothetical protein